MAGIEPATPALGAAEPAPQHGPGAGPQPHIPMLAAMPRGQLLRAGIHREAGAPRNIALPLALLPTHGRPIPARLGTLITARSVSPLHNTVVATSHTTARVARVRADCRAPLRNPPLLVD